MKKLAKALLAFLFMNAIAIFLMLLAIKLSGFSGEVIKQRMRDSGFYTAIIGYINQNVDTNNQIDINQVQGADAVAQLIKSQLTTTYLQTKLEKFIDDSQQYVTGATTHPPSLSFNDFKEKLFGNDNPDLSHEINQTKSNAEAFNPEPAQADASFPGGVDFSHKDFTVRMDQPLAYLRTSYRWYTLSLYLSGLITLLSFALIVYLSPTRQDRYKTVANLLLSTALLVFLPFVILSRASDTIGKTVIIQYPQYAQLGKAIFDAFFTAMFAQYNYLQNITMVAFFIIAGLCYVEYFVLRKLERVDDQQKHETIVDKTAPAAPVMPPPPPLVIPTPPTAR